MAVAAVPLQAEYSKLIQSRSTLNATGPDLFGDRVNLFTGALEFVQEDVSLPGNSALPVSAGRRFVEGHGAEWDVTMLGHFGDWDLEIPRIHGVFSASAGWTVRVNGALSSKRCSSFGAPPEVDADQGTTGSAFSAGEYWHGTFLYLPGSGDHEILKRSTANSLQPNDGKTYPLVTKADAAISCIAINGQKSNEGFRVRTPDGRTYTFDHLVQRDHTTLSKGFYDAMDYTGTNAVVPVQPDGYKLDRREYWMLPTQTSDRYGNTVTYDWNATVPWQLDEIRGYSSGESTDRVLTFSYYPGSYGNNPPRIQFIDADTPTGSTEPRRWEYIYDQGRLTQVKLPDSSTWQFSLLSLLSADVGEGGNCDIVAADGPVASGFLVHPSGAKGTFETTPIVRTRT